MGANAVTQLLSGFNSSFAMGRPLEGADGSLAGWLIVIIFRPPQVPLASLSGERLAREGEDIILDYVKAGRKAGPEESDGEGKVR